MLAPWKESYDKPNSIFKSRGITLPTNFHRVEAMVFPVVIYRCESWTIRTSGVLKNWCFQTVALEKTLEGPLGFREIKPINSKGNQPWIFLEELLLKLKLHRLIGKDLDAGKDWGQEENQVIVLRTGRIFPQLFCVTHNITATETFNFNLNY